MPKIETWFPTAIYQEEKLFSDIENKYWDNYVKTIEQTYKSGGDEWEGGTYTTHGTNYDLIKDPIFAPLVTTVTNHVNAFATLHNSNHHYTPSGAWLNVATGHNFQEMHTHNESMISAVYYISAPPGSGKIVFEDPREPDMLPLKNILVRNDLSYIKVGYEAQEGFLVIFRSYLRHMVLSGKNTDRRISVAFNF
jgi:uncharacterized protein (TIGR02466 family)